VAQVTTQPPISRCRSHAACTALIAGVLLTLLVGCAGTPPRGDHSEELLAIRQRLDRIREIVRTGQPGPAALNEIQRLRAGLDAFPEPLVVRSLTEAFRPDDDAANAVFIKMMDDRDAGNFVPVPHRVRVETIHAAVQLAAVPDARISQADALLADIRRRAADQPQALIAAWLHLLESPPLYASGPAGKVDITARVQGLALLGVLRNGSGLDLDSVLRRMQSDTVTAPPVLFSQWLIHLSGERLKPTLAAWLAGSSAQQAQAAAVAAVHLLRFQSLKLQPTAEDLQAASTWVATLPDRITWRRLVVQRLQALSQAEPSDTSAREQLGHALRRLGTPQGDDPIRWLETLSPADQTAALERLLGLPMLLHPPR